MAARFFVDGILTPGAEVRFASGDAHKIASVLRLSAGDLVAVVDSAGREFDARLQRASSSEAIATVERERAARELSRDLVLTIAQGIPKGAKMDFVVEKLSELGVYALIPFHGERSVARDVGAAKLERWRRLALTSAQQCGRRRPLVVEDEVEYSQIVETFGRFDVVLFPWELADPVPLRERLPHLLTGARRVLAVIGPEGGFSSDEVETATAAGATVISLGSRIFRTETAGLVVASLIDYEASPAMLSRDSSADG